MLAFCAYKPMGMGPQALHRRVPVWVAIFGMVFCSYPFGGIVGRRRAGIAEVSVGTLRGGNGEAKDPRHAVARKELFVVTAQPAKGVTCTDLRAFSCTGSAFAYADIEIELGGRRVGARDGPHCVPCSRACAKLDAPHGLAVKMAASINLLIVYSRSAGKFWVMAGKVFDRRGGPAQTLRAEDVFGADSYESTLLVLMKRAVISCQAPGYSIHVSPLYLFLGENTGVRVWKLRSLIKPTSSGRSRSKLKSRLVHLCKEHATRC
uniref:Uncharacterized protein n=2 Tax=Physcomitrium patens TaxID=3218 RepID=A0A2K1JC12_PHYPA|nr:hypothetical protein PHYPA_019344 [Physcomitrium patens]